MTQEIAWLAPAGFHLYRSDWSVHTWVERVLAETAPEETQEPALRRSLNHFTEVAATKSDPDDLDLWLAGIVTTTTGRQVLAVTGSISFAPLVDVNTVAQEWRQEQSRSQAVVAEVEVSPSRRAPVVAAREIYLERNEPDHARYREWGLALRPMSAHGLSVRMELDTPDLTVLPDLMSFLVESIRDVSLTSEEDTA